MSFAFEARFSPTALDLPTVLSRLEAALVKSKIHFQNQIMRLDSRNGVPTAISTDAIDVASLSEVAVTARKWWGIGLSCVSEPLLGALGRTDAIEVGFTLFRSPDARIAITYDEAKGAFAARKSDPDLAGDLFALLIRVAAALQIEIAIYAEEAENGPLVPTFEEAMRVIEDAGQSSHSPDQCIVVSSRLLPFEAARERAGRRADRVRLSPAGYVLFPFIE